MSQTDSTLSDAAKPLVFRWLDIQGQEDIRIDDSSFLIAPSADSLNDKRGVVERTSAGVIFYSNGSDVLLNGELVEQAWLKEGDVIELGGQSMSLVSMGHLTTQSKPNRPTPQTKNTLRSQLTHAIQARSIARGRLRASAARHVQCCHLWPWALIHTLEISAPAGLGSRHVPPRAAPPEGPSVRGMDEPLRDGPESLGQASVRPRASCAEAREPSFGLEPGVAFLVGLRRLVLCSAPHD